MLLFVFASTGTNANDLLVFNFTANVNLHSLVIPTGYFSHFFFHEFISMAKQNLFI